MDFKKHLFFIVTGVVVLGAIALYFFTVPAVNAEAGTARNNCLNMAKQIHDKAVDSSKPDVIITDEHVRCATDYSKQLSSQVQELNGAQAKNETIDLHFKNIKKDPPTGLDFDIWLEELRNNLLKEAATAGLDVRKLDTDKLLFKEHSDTAGNADITKRPEYRIRHLAITEEIWDILCTKFAKGFEAADFGPLGDKRKRLDLGALALEKLAIGEPHASSDNSVWVDSALKRKGNSNAKRPAAKGAPAPALPYTTTSVELQFVAPPQVLPQILKALETTGRFFAVIDKADVERANAIYPSPSDENIRQAGPDAATNTYYMEGPVRVSLTLDIYEFDNNRATAFLQVLSDKPAAAAKPADKSGKPAK